MTAQYVRLVLFVIVVVLLFSIGSTAGRSGWWFESSISDYFHTPARLALVASMFAIGVSLITLYSSVWYENALLNTAGAFAPMVGFAATTQATNTKSPFAFDVATAHVDTLAEQTLPGYFLALGLFAALILRVHSKHAREKFLRTFPLVVLLALLTWLCWSERFDTLLPGRRSVHTAAAFGFFLPLIVLVFLTASNFKRGSSEKVPWNHQKLYFLLGTLMFGAGLFLLLDKKVLHLEEEQNWPYSVLVVELVLIACFAVFWLAEYFRVRKLGTSQI